MDMEKKQKLYIMLFMFFMGMAISALFGYFVGPLCVGLVSMIVLIIFTVLSQMTQLFYFKGYGDVD